MLGTEAIAHACTQDHRDTGRAARSAAPGADAKTAFEKDGLFDKLKKALAERVLNAELDHHLETEAAEGQSNRRNGYGRKTALTDTGRIELEVPRDRTGSFELQLIAKHQRRFPGFDEKIVSMYARGMSTREIQGHLRELYGLEVSPALISTVTDAVLEEVAAWQARPLESVYPLVFFDALRVMNELKNRGVEDLLIAVVDGLKGFPAAIRAAFLETTVQTCIVHLLRNSLDFVSWKDRKAVTAALKDK